MMSAFTPWSPTQWAAHGAARATELREQFARGENKISRCPEYIRWHLHGIPGTAALIAEGVSAGLLLSVPCGGDCGCCRSACS